jgi:hypothetical protein
MSYLLLAFAVSGAQGEISSQSDIVELPDSKSVQFNGMAFSENVIEIPRVLPGKRVSVEINVENRCPNSFEISKVLVSCGCLNVSAKVKTIAQGDSSRFKFEFQSPKNSGVFALSADLVDETNNRTLRLVFKGACEPIRVHPVLPWVEV